MPIVFLLVLKIEDLKVFSILQAVITNHTGPQASNLSIFRGKSLKCYTSVGMIKGNTRSKKDQREVAMRIPHTILKVHNWSRNEADT